MKIHEATLRGDIAGVLAELRAGVPVDSREDGSDLSVLALACAQPDASTEMVRLLINAGAKIDTEVLRTAFQSGSVGTIAQILEAGPGIDSVDEMGQYGSLIYAAYGRSSPGDATLLPILEFLIENGADIDRTSSYGESALRIVSSCGRFDAVQLLLDWGAKREALQWTELMYAIAIGTLGEMEALLAQGVSLDDRDSWSRTPWLLSVQTGDIGKARLLLDAGANRSDVGHCGTTPLIYAVQGHYPEMLSWLIAEGFDINETNKFGETPLKIAAERGYADLVALLLQAGASREIASSNHESPLAVASNLAVARMLVTEGYDLSGLGESARFELLAVRGGEPRTTPKEFDTGRVPYYGRNNPERLNIPFWHAMIQSGCNAGTARRLFTKNEAEQYETGPVWCYDRFGRSTTLLPDGRIIEVGGEHEDFYDADFCIYNDVVVFDGNGHFDIYGYPKTVFPPTDFHTATLVGESLYIIGNLGYVEARVPGETPVYKLDCRTFKIVHVLASGQKPGWISHHRARYDAITHTIHIEGGKYLLPGGKLTHNTNRYALDLHRLRWQLL